MNRQPDNKPADPLFMGQPREVFAIECSRPPRVIFERARDAQLGISQRNANSHCSIIDPGDPNIWRCHPSIGSRVSAVSKCPCSKNLIEYSCTRLSFMKKLCSTGTS